MAVSFGWKRSESLPVNRNTFRIAIGVLAVLLIALSSTAYSVREQHTALVNRFGKNIDTIEEAGLHWKLPWPIDKVVDIDRRRRVFNTRNTEMLTQDKRNVILLSYVQWRVADALRFYQAVGSIEGADSKLDGLVTNAKIAALGENKLSAFVSTNPEDLKVEEVEASILADVRAVAFDEYGIEVERVGFKRLSLPEENITSVFTQMRAERQKEAQGLRALGETSANQIRKDTDLEVAKLVAAAEKEAEETRGAANAEAARIYREAQEGHEEFYVFLRQLEGLSKILGENASVILRTDSQPFQLLKSEDGE